MVTFTLPNNSPHYLFCVVGFCLIIRFLLVLLRWLQLRHEYPLLEPYFFGYLFIGFTSDRVNNDFALPIFVGLLELSVYPILLAAGKPEYIGAWLGFKTLPILGAWTKNREHYQRFLIGNALALIASYFLMTLFYTCSSFH